jgi:hypothetical protein
MDDIRPPRQSGTPTYGRQPAPGQQLQQNLGYEPQQEQHQAYDYQQYNVNPVATKNSSGRSKKRIFWNILVLLAFIALLVLAGYQYMKIQELNEDVTELKVESKRLIQKIDSLEYDNLDLNRKLELQQDEYSELLDISESLKTTCGTACNSIDIPQ